MNTKAPFLALALLATPYFAHAATLQSTLGVFGDLIQTATPIVVALALLYFFYGLANYLLSPGEDGKATKKGLTIMFNGLLVFFVIVSIWGLVGILQDTFDVGGNNNITPPTVNTVNTRY